eukprot:1103220_1
MLSTCNALRKFPRYGRGLVVISKHYKHHQEKLDTLNERMQTFTEIHEDINNSFESIQQKFMLSMDIFHDKLYLYPSYARKFHKTFENMICSTNNAYDSTKDVMQSIEDEQIANHATQETLDKIKSDMKKLDKLNDAIRLFYDIATVLDESTKKIDEISSKYQVYSELNYHLYPDKVQVIEGMQPLFPNIEDLKHLKGPFMDNPNENEVIGVCYDAVGRPNISPIWFKYDKSESVWRWSPFDPFSSEWDMFGYEWLSVEHAAIEGEFGGELFDGSGPEPVNVNIIEYLYDHNPLPSSE